MNIFGAEDEKHIFDITFDDLGENFLSGIILTKLAREGDSDNITIQLQLNDIFYFDITEVPPEKYELSIPSKRGISRDIKKLVDSLLGINPSNNEETFTRISYKDYFGSWLSRTLGYLRDGDSCGTKPVIDHFEVVDSDITGTPAYKVQLSKSKFIESFRSNIVSQVYFGEETYSKAISSLELSIPAISADKQVSFLRQFLESRTEQTGEVEFSFLLSQFNFRRVMLPLSMPNGEIALMPSPLSPRSGVKASLPLLLAAQGEIDIQQIKIKSPISAAQKIDIQFSICKPATRNIFGSGFCSLPNDVRERMSAVEIACYEKISKTLQANFCFYDNPTLEKNFIQFSTWALKQISFCLEEPSYLKHKSTTWLNENKEKNYKKMEDDLFLPFIYEKLRERFGNIIQKKPERFGGNVDILFGELPIELKVRKGHKEALIDSIIDEKYKPTSQAAAYAALTRLGCVLVLDVPTSEPSITNITSCVRIVTKSFPEADLPTSVLVFVFQCNTPKPSSAI